MFLNKVENMAKLSNPEEVLWARRVVQALAWRKKYSREEEWPAIDQVYAHVFAEAQMPHFNLIYMMGQTLVPALVFQTPGILNTPTTQQAVFGASVYDSIDNWWIQHSELKDIAKEVVLSSYLHNVTATQIGYDFDTPSDTLRRDEEAGEIFEKVSGSADRTRSKNAPWVDLIPSHRFLVAVNTRSMRNCSWAAKLVSTPLSSLKKIKGLKNLESTKLPEEIHKQETIVWQHRDMDEYCHFWEIHDAVSGKWMWLGTHGNFIMSPEIDPLQVYGLPFEVTSFNKNTQSIWGTPDAVYVKSQQLEGDECRKFGMFQRRLAVPKCFYNSNILTPEKMDVFLSPTVGAGIPVNINGDDDIRRHILPITPPTANFLYSQYQRDLLNDAQLINGFGPNQMGTFAPGRRTAKETSVVEQNNSTRMAFRRFEVSEIFRSHVTRANMLIADNWTQNIIEQVVGVDGAIYWVKSTPKEIQALKNGLVTNVNVESLAPVSRERRKMEALELLKLLGTMQQAGANPMPILKQLLSTYEWVDVRQILPQYYKEYTMQEYQDAQQKAISEGGLGSKIASNTQGIMALNERLPSGNIQQGNANGQQEPDGDESTGG